jgi:hypothetical protein
MFVVATDWATVSALATGFGTLVLAVATFAAVRSSNRSARIAEVALQEQRRPFLTHSRLADPTQKLAFGDRHWVSVEGGKATAEYVDGNVYLSLSLRNVGSGIAVCQAWIAIPGMVSGVLPGVVSQDALRRARSHAPLQSFRPQSRDLFVPPGDIGMWQGALRDAADPLRAPLAAAIEAGDPVSVELLYSDLIGRQRTITRFAMIPAGEDRYASMSRHWYLDWDGPRPAEEMSHAVADVATDDITEPGQSPAVTDAGVDVEPA